MEGKMIKIHIGQLKYSQEWGGRWAPLPYGEFESDEVEIIGRLIRTRGGGADWKAGMEWLPHIPNSVCPKINIIGRRVRVLLTSERISLRNSSESKCVFLNGWIFLDSNPNSSELIIRQLNGFSRRGDLFCRITAEEVFSSRPFRKELIERATSGIDEGEKRVQGNLNIYLLHNFQVKDEEWKLFSSRNLLKFFNHTITGPMMVTGFDLHRLIILSGQGYVVSPDHLEEPIRLEKGIYLLFHPLPKEVD